MPAHVIQHHPEEPAPRGQSMWRLRPPPTYILIIIPYRSLVLYITYIYPPYSSYSSTDRPTFGPDLRVVALGQHGQVGQQRRGLPTMKVQIISQKRGAGVPTMKVQAGSTSSVRSEERVRTMMSHSDGAL